MRQSPPVFVATSAYGADLVRALGQAQVLPWIAAAGADGIEIRRELFTDDAPPLAALREAIAAHGLATVYSVPLELWQEDGRLAGAALRQALHEAALLGAGVLKVSLGHYAAGAALDALGAVLADTPVHLLVENDQTVQGGTVAPLAAFFAAAAAAGVAVAMTFDLGNWHWTGSDPEAAARALGAYVAYVHCKRVLRDGGRLKAVPPEGAMPDWAACFGYFRAGLPRAIEFPLAGEALDALTAVHVARLRSL